MRTTKILSTVSLGITGLCIAACGASSASSALNPTKSSAGSGNTSAAASASTAATAASTNTTTTTTPAPAPTSTVAGQVLVDASAKIAPIQGGEIGTNLAVWYDVEMSGLPSQVASLSPHMLRWPGGSTSDTYHWQNHTECSAKGQSSTAYEQHSTFDNFMSAIVTPGNYEAAITVDYGSDPTCTTGGLPTEAAAWVAYAKAKGYNQHIHHWTVGNEVFGGWEFDLHAKPNDPTTYAGAMSGASGYYQLMKAADSTAQVGVVALGGSGLNNWDSIVLANAPYDYVEIHWYAQQPGSESDQYLLYQAPAALTATIATLRSELAAAGKANTPIMLGEFNSVAYNPGKQTTSIVNALFAGMAFGEVLNDNLAVATWWFGAGGTQNCGHNNSSSLYGWQNFGGYDLVAANTQYAWNGCNTGPTVPEGTLFPSGQAFALVSRFAQPGNSMLAASVNASLPDVRAYAATQGTGYALMLFNLNQSTASTVTVSLANAASSSYKGAALTYGKAQYDTSANNVWTGPVSTPVSVSGTSATVTLPPYSMTVLTLQ